jgi:hypothetical protein
LSLLATKTRIRDAKGDTVKKLIGETAQHVIDMLNLRFGRLTHNGKQMNVGEKATTDSIVAMMEQLKVFSDNYNFGKPDRGLVFELPLFKEFADQAPDADQLRRPGPQVRKCVVQVTATAAYDAGRVRGDPAHPGADPDETNKY